MIRENALLSTEGNKQQRQKTALDSLQFEKHQQAFHQRPLSNSSKFQPSSMSSPPVILSAGQIGVNYNTGHIDARIEEQFKQAVFNISQQLMNGRPLSSSSIEIIHVVIIVLNRAEIPKIDRIFDDCILSMMTRVLPMKDSIIGTRKKIGRAYQVVGFPDPIVKIELRATARVTATRERENGDSYRFENGHVGPQL